MQHEPSVRHLKLLELFDGDCKLQLHLQHLKDANLDVRGLSMLRRALALVVAFNLLVAAVLFPLANVTIITIERISSSSM